MTTTTAPGQCECCGQPVGSTGHFDHDEYPVGIVLCRVCFRDRLLGQRLGVQVSCSRTGSLDHADLAANRYTEISEDGARTEPAEGWTGAPPQRVLLVPRPDDEEDEEGGDDDGPAAA